MRDQRLDRQRGAGDSLDDLGGGEQAPQPVDPLAQERKEWRRVARAERVIERGHFAAELLHELRRDGVADGVGREEAEHSLGPVSVLQAAGAIVGRGDAKEAAVGLRPRAGQLGRDEGSADERPLEVHADVNVQVVAGARRR